MKRWSKKQPLAVGSTRTPKGRDATWSRAIFPRAAQRHHWGMFGSQWAKKPGYLYAVSFSFKCQRGRAGWKKKSAPPSSDFERSQITLDLWFHNVGLSCSFLTVFARCISSEKTFPFVSRLLLLSQPNQPAVDLGIHGPWKPVQRNLQIRFREGHERIQAEFISGWTPWLTPGPTARFRGIHVQFLRC